ncbi:hypothetical protein [Prosthecochloris sp. SCSIO W1101]|uniref:hypothetical protein n=1 Tax=Prosthecochloris sp. SCSIO W1101 TaxID=2992242 RepID=UPI002AC85BBC|nr:hypothetical protein [Prosthecochloris sp. SCSIO W1101]
MDFFTFPFAATSVTPTVLTLHGRLDMPVLVRMLQIYTDLNYVSISNAQRFPVPNVNWAGTVYHGYPPKCFPFNESPSDTFFIWDVFLLKKHLTRQFVLRRLAVFV